MQKYWLRSVWRSKATALLGAVVVLLALFSGFPGWLERGLYFLSGILIVIFGLAGIKPDPGAISNDSPSHEAGPHP